MKVLTRQMSKNGPTLGATASRQEDIRAMRTQIGNCDQKRRIRGKRNTAGKATTGHANSAGTKLGPKLRIIAKHGWMGVSAKDTP